MTSRKMPIRKPGHTAAPVTLLKGKAAAVATHEDNVYSSEDDGEPDWKDAKSGPSKTKDDDEPEDEPVPAHLGKLFEAVEEAEQQKEEDAKDVPKEKTSFEKDPNDDESEDSSSSEDDEDDDDAATEKMIVSTVKQTVKKPPTSEKEETDEPVNARTSVRVDIDWNVTDFRSNSTANAVDVINEGKQLMRAWMMFLSGVSDVHPSNHSAHFRVLIIPEVKYADAGACATTTKAKVPKPDPVQLVGTKVTPTRPNTTGIVSHIITFVDGHGSVVEHDDCPYDVHVAGYRRMNAGKTAENTAVPWYTFLFSLLHGGADLSKTYPCIILVFSNNTSGHNKNLFEAARELFDTPTRKRGGAHDETVADDDNEKAVVQKKPRTTESSNGLVVSKDDFKDIMTAVVRENNESTLKVVREVMNQFAPMIKGAGDFLSKQRDDASVPALPPAKHQQAIGYYDEEEDDVPKPKKSSSSSSSSKKR